MENLIHVLIDYWMGLHIMFKNSLHAMQHVFFYDYFMTFGVYDRVNKKFVVVYKYDTPVLLLYVMLKSIFISKNHMLLSAQAIDAFSTNTDKYIKVGSYFDDDGLHYLLDDYNRYNSELEQCIFCSTHRNSELEWFMDGFTTVADKSE